MSKILYGQNEITVKDGSRLIDVLPSFSAFCNGQGTCGACRVRLTPAPDPTARDVAFFTQEQLAQGWRLGCGVRVTGDVRVERVAPVCTREQVSDEPCEGIAIDLGTTTVVVSAVGKGRALRRVAERNAQCVIGADVLSRIAYAERVEGGAGVLRSLVATQLAELIDAVDPERNASHIVIAANTVMQHLLLGASVEGLGRAPYTRAFSGTVRTDGAVIHPDRKGARLTVLPSVSSYVGGDITAGIAMLEERVDGDYLLVDLGTNGEIVYRKGDRRLCVSTAAGPAYEGGVSCGASVGQGAVTAVRLVNGAIRTTVEGGGKPLGFCGSGLVDLLYALRLTGALRHDGRLKGGAVTVDGLTLTQRDVRALQTANAAIRAGIDVLTEGATVPIYLAGAFGTHTCARSAVAIGLLPHTDAHAVGNLALTGAERAVQDEGVVSRMEEIARTATGYDLAAHASWESKFLERMNFPALFEEEQ